MIRPNFANAAWIILFAVLGLWAFKQASKTQLATVPILGDAIRFGASVAGG